MIMKKLAFVLFIVSIFLACKKDKSYPNDKDVFVISVVK